MPWMRSSSAPSTSPLSCLPDCELGHDPVECHLGCAGSADRGVPTRTRHHNDGNRGRFDSRRRETPVSMRARARPIGPRRLFSGAQAQIRPRSSADFKRTPSRPQNGQSTNHAGSGMARPGLDPGTPRFSVDTSKRAAGAKSLETARFQQNRCSAQMFGICGLFPSILGLTDTSGPRRPHVPIGYDGKPATRFAQT